MRGEGTRCVLEVVKKGRWVHNGKVIGGVVREDKAVVEKEHVVGLACQIAPPLLLLGLCFSRGYSANACVSLA